MERAVQILKGEPLEPRSNLRTVRVGAYCRVSTDEKDQESSLDLQVNTFKSRVSMRQGWELVDIYVDNGISGTQASKRPEFQRMVQDCRDGKLDYVITKSISRFARNTVECLSYVREMQSYGTQILFENDNIDTGTPYSEMLLTILAAFAQEESRSISENVKWGIRKRFEAGMPTNSKLIGYDLIDGEYKVNPVEAETVHRIFDLYETGKYSYAAIAKKMEEEGRKTGTGGARWDGSRIYIIIHNEKYVGDVLMQKVYTVNHLTHKVVQNKDRVIPQYQISNHHEQIITRKQFERCNAISALKNNRGVPVQYPYSDKLVCPVCGHRLYHHATKGRDWIIGWHCDRDEGSCRKYIVRDKVLDKSMLQAVNSLDYRELENKGFHNLSRFKREKGKMNSVHYWWLDEYVDRITFGKGHTLTVHWKDGQLSGECLATTVQMTCNFDSTDPVLLPQLLDKGVAFK